MKQLFTFLFLITLTLFSLPGSGGAQNKENESVFSQVNIQELELLVSTLENPAARYKLTQQLKTLIAAQKQIEGEKEYQTLSAQFFSFISTQVATLSHQLVTLGSTFLDTPRVMKWAKQKIADKEVRERWWLLFLQLLLILAAGLLAHKLTFYSLRKPYQILDQRGYLSKVARLPLLLGRTFLEIVPALSFMLVALGVLETMAAPPGMRVVALAVINSTILVAIFVGTADFFLSPSNDALRLFPLSNETANYLHIWVRRIAYVAVYGYFISSAGFALGMPGSSYEALLKLVGFIISIMVIVLILQNRRDIAQMLRRENAKAPSDSLMPDRWSAWRLLAFKLAHIWHVLAIAYVIAIYSVFALGIEGGLFYIIRASLLTILICVFARILVKGSATVFDRIFTISPKLKSQYPNLEPRANLYLPIVHKIVRIGILLVAASSVLTAWGINSFAWLAAPLGQRIVTSGVAILAIVMLAIVAWEAVNQGIDRYLNSASTVGQKIQRSARAKTILPLLRTILFGLLITIVGLMTLSELGFNIAPLLAGAGIIGLAIGFGSQALVKDLITGLFYVFEDTIAIGDVVDIGNKHAGLVEAMTIRTVKLRDFSGAVHTIPFSEVTSVINMTKDFSYAVFEVGVSYRENIEQVMDIMRMVGAELQQDPELNVYILDALEIAGLERFGDSGIIIKARIKTKPIHQWKVMRAYNLRLKKKFDELNIEIPFPTRTMVVANPKNEGDTLRTDAYSSPSKGQD